MDNACWSCGDPTHHARDCKNSADVGSNIKREIQMHRYASGTSRRNTMSLADKQAKIQVVLNNPLPPVT